MGITLPITETVAQFPIKLTSSSNNRNTAKSSKPAWSKSQPSTVKIPTNKSPQSTSEMSVTDNNTASDPTVQLSEASELKNLIIPQDSQQSCRQCL